MRTIFVLAVFIALAAGQEILHHDSDIHPDGSYHYNYETSDGLVGKVDGEASGEVAGSYKYTDAEGGHFEVTYTAGENGFVPHGAHIPEIPEAIARALVWAAANPYKGDK